MGKAMKHVRSAVTELCRVYTILLKRATGIMKNCLAPDCEGRCPASQKILCKTGLFVRGAVRGENSYGLYSVRIFIYFKRHGYT